VCVCVDAISSLRSHLTACAFPLAFSLPQCRRVLFWPKFTCLLHVLARSLPCPARRRRRRTRYIHPVADRVAPTLSSHPTLLSPGTEICSSFTTHHHQHHHSHSPSSPPRLFRTAWCRPALGVSLLLSDCPTVRLPDCSHCAAPYLPSDRAWCDCAPLEVARITPKTRTKKGIEIGFGFDPSKAGEHSTTLSRTFAKPRVYPISSHRSLPIGPL
jgi:hypothetical protein